MRVEQRYLDMIDLDMIDLDMIDAARQLLYLENQPD